MRSRRSILIVVIVIAVVVVLVAGYNILRRPAMFRNLTDQSLSAEETEELRSEIAAREDKQILVAYFSYSGTTRGVAEALSEQTEPICLKSPPRKNTEMFICSQTGKSGMAQGRPFLIQWKIWTSMILCLSGTRCGGMQRLRL